jgi:hypothetical protein
MFRDLNDPDKHDGTQQKLNFGGPYHVYISYNGEVLMTQEVGKGDELNISYAPRGKTEDMDE